MHIHSRAWAVWLLLLALAFGFPKIGRAGDIHVAISEDRFEDAIKLIQANPELLKESDHQQNKPVHLAALKGSEALMKVILGFKPQVNPRNKFGQTPLHRAMVSGSEAITRMLVEAGAEVNGRDSQGIIPIHLAAQRKHTAIVTFLLEKGAEVDAFDAFKRRPLHMAIIGSEDLVVKSIIKSGADYKYQDTGGNNYLLLAAGSGNPDVTTTFLDLDLGVNSTNKSGLTPLHAASQNGHVKVVEVLEKRGADLSLKTKNGNTALDLVKHIRPPYRFRQHDEVQRYLEKWTERLSASPAQP
jgi:ankyrin repeat protein